MRALGAEGSSPGSSGVASCSTGSQVVAALANPAVSVALLTSHVILDADDFAPYALPIRRTGNFTILGAYEPRALWPRLDMAYLQNKVWLAPGVWWILERLVLYRPREPPLFLAIGMDILAVDTGRDPGAVPSPTAEPSAVVLIRNGILVQRSCLPPDLGDASANSLPRPMVTGAGLPQRSTATLSGPAPGCVEGEGAPPALQCYAAQGEYVDQSSYGIQMGDFGRAERLGYAMWSLGVTYTCEVVMSMECIGGLGLFGCFYSLLPHLGPGGVVINPPTNQTAAAAGSGGGGGGGVGPALAPPASGGAGGPAAAELAGEDRGGAGGGGSGGRKVLAPVLGGVLGGVAALALVSAVVWLAVRRRRRQLDGTAAGKGDPEKGGAVQQEPLTSGCGAASPLAVAVLASGAEVQVDLGAGTGKAEGGGLMEGQASGQGAVPGEWTNESSLLSTDPLEASLVPVTPLAPLRRDIPLNVKAQEGSKQDAASQPAPPHPAPARKATSPAAALARFFSPSSSAAAAASDAASAPPPPQDAAAADGATGTANRSAQQLTLLPVTIGKGAYGRVVEGLYGGQKVAVKVIDTGLMAVALLEEARVAAGAASSATGSSISAEAVGGLAGAGVGGVGPERTVRALVATLAAEVEVLARCQHPNVVRLLAANLRPPRPLLVMELMDTSLDRLMAATPGRRMPLAKVLHVGAQLARALSYLHPTVIHRDIKPANVLISNPHSDTPTAKLADFGLARLRSSVLVTQNPEVGTGPYMAPECFDVYNTAITAKADMYSLGVLLWEMGSGEAPWEGLPMVAVARAVALEGSRLPLLPLLSRGCPQKLVRLVVGCWEADPLRRPAASEAHKQLLLALQEAELGAGAGSGPVADAGAGSGGGQGQGQQAGVFGAAAE